MDTGSLRVTLETATEDDLPAGGGCPSDFCARSMLESVYSQLADLERSNFAIREKLSSNEIVIVGGDVPKNLPMTTTSGSNGRQVCKESRKCNSHTFALICEKVISTLPVIFLLVIVSYLIFSILVYTNCISISNISHCDLVNMVKFFGIGILSVTSVLILMSLSYISGKKVANLDKMREIEQTVKEEKETLRRERELFMRYREEEYSDIRRRLFELDERILQQIHN